MPARILLELLMYTWLIVNARLKTPELVISTWLIINPCMNTNNTELLMFTWLIVNACKNTTRIINVYLSYSKCLHEYY